MAATSLSLEEALKQAVEHHQAGRLQEAERFYRAILEAQPAHPDANHNMGILALQVGKPEAGLPFLQKALESQPGVGQYWLDFAEALIRCGRPDTAVQLLAQGRARGLAGEPVDALEARARGGMATPPRDPFVELAALRESGAYAQAADWLDRYLAVHADDAAALAQAAHIRLLLHKEGEASAFIEKAVRRSPDLPVVRRNLARVLLARRQPAEALEAARQACQAGPDDAENRLVLASCLGANGQTAQALELVEAIVADKPDYAEALAQRAVFRFQTGAVAAALADAQLALSKKPHLAQVWYLASMLHEQSGQAAEAMTAMEEAVRREPDRAVFLTRLGELRRLAGRLDEAIALQQRATTLEPGRAEAWANYGVALQQAERFEEAGRAYEQALAVNANLAEAHGNLGVLAEAQGRWEDALRHTDRALECNPGLVSAYQCRGAALKGLGRLDEALDCLQRSLPYAPDCAEAHTNIAILLSDLGALDKAEKAFAKALQLAPDNVETACNYAVLLANMKRHAEADCVFGGIPESEDETPAVSLLRSHYLWHRRQFAPARQFAEKAAAAAKTKTRARALSQLSMCEAYLSDFRRVKALSDAALDLLPDNESLWEQRLYSLSYHPELAAEAILDEFVRWGDEQAAPDGGAYANVRDPDRPLRVGFVSPDLRRHTSRFYFAPLFEHHDRQAISLYAYSNALTPDDWTERFEGWADQWRDIRGVSDAAAAALIREDGIDILIDACGHMVDHRLGVFARKPAPIQVTWLGSAWTTGLPTMDYVLFDPFLAPEGTLAREKIVRLPQCFVAYRPPQRALVEPAPEVVAGRPVTFGYSGRTERLNPRVFRAWGAILRRLPEARLILDYPAFTDAGTVETYTETFAQCGIDVSRVVFRCSENIFEGLNDIDVLLDSFPHSGGTMLFDALWMGVPVVTLESRPPVGCIGASLLRNLGLTDWVAGSEAEYVEKAVTLSRDRDLVTELHRTMRDRLRRSPIMDESGFTRNMERALREMWRRYCAGGEPEAFSL